MTYCFIRWRFVVHGGIDGFSPLIVFFYNAMLIIEVQLFLAHFKMLYTSIVSQIELELIEAGKMYGYYIIFCKIN